MKDQRKIYGTGHIGNVYDHSAKGVISFTVANNDWDSKTKTETTDWLNCVIFDRDIDRLTKQLDRLQKGAFISFEGDLKFTEYQGQKSIQIQVRSYVTKGKPAQQDSYQGVDVGGYEATPTANTVSAPVQQAPQNNSGGQQTYDDIPF